MANEVMEKEQPFSELLEIQLNSKKDALPADFNQPKFIHNSVAFLNGSSTLIKYVNENKTFGKTQLLLGFSRAAMLGLDAMHNECYLIPYYNKELGKTYINFVTSFIGMQKLALKYSQRPIESFTADIVHEGDSVRIITRDGKRIVDTNINPLETKKPVIGAIAICTYKDGNQDCEFIPIEELEIIRNQSKAKNSLAWSSFRGEMYKKAAMRRLCKSITLDLDSIAYSELNSGLELETDQKELRNREVQENENSEDFIEVESEVVSG